MKIFNWRRLRELTLRGYDFDTNLDRDLEILLKVNEDKRREKEYLVPKSNKRKSINSIRISRSKSECGFFLQEYPRDIDYLDEAVIVPEAIVDEMMNTIIPQKVEEKVNLKPVRVSRGCPGYNYYLKEYPYDVERIDDSIIVPSSILKR